MERIVGVEPTPQLWKSRMQPQTPYSLNHLFKTIRIISYSSLLSIRNKKLCYHHRDNNTTFCLN